MDGLRSEVKQADANPKLFRSSGEGKEAGFISLAVFNCAGVLVSDAGNFFVEILEKSIALLYE